jgi:hypothetical protein
VGGYYTGIKTLVQYDSTNDNRKLTYFGKFEPNGLIGWTIAYPTIQPHDLVKERSVLHQVVGTVVCHHGKDGDDLQCATTQ